jgi:hypothetical protein
MHEIIIGNYDALRKGRSGMTKTAHKKWVKEHGKERNMIADLIAEYRGNPDWSRVEKIKNAYEILSGINEDLVFPPDIMKKLTKAAVQPITSLPGGQRGIVWFCAQDIVKKQTKNGKPFIAINALDDSNSTVRLRVWGQFKEELEPFTMWMAEVEMDPSWGASTSAMKMKRIEV